jgi:hypothetical protein
MCHCQSLFQTARKLDWTPSSPLDGHQSKQQDLLTCVWWTAAAENMRSEADTGELILCYMVVMIVWLCVLLQCWYQVNSFLAQTKRNMSIEHKPQIELMGTLCTISVVMLVSGYAEIVPFFRSLYEWIQIIFALCMQRLIMFCFVW